MNIIVDQISGKFSSGRHGALANAQLSVDDGRVVKHKGFRRRGRAAFVQERHRTLQNFLRVLAWIGHRRRAADKHRVGAIETADADQPADDVGEVRTEDAAIGMQLVDDNVFEVHKKLLPFGVVRQNARMQHVGIGHHDMPLAADGPARVIGRVSVVGEGFDVGLQVGNEAVRLVHLVLRERLGGKQIQRARLRFVEDALHHRQVVAKRLAAGRGRDEHHVLTITDEAHGLGLMPVEPLHAALCQYVFQLRIHPVGPVFVISGFGRNIHHRRRVGGKTFIFFKSRHPFLKRQFCHAFWPLSVLEGHYR